jgi:hypothetical protein
MLRPLRFIIQIFDLQCFNRFPHSSILVKVPPLHQPSSHEGYIKKAVMSKPDSEDNWILTFTVRLQVH